MNRNSPLRYFSFFLSVTVLSLSLPPLSFAGPFDNILQNASFEAAIGGGSNWDNTANRGLSLVAGGVDGSQFLRLDEADIVLGSAGVFTFQTITGVSPGQIVAFGGFVRVNSLDGGDAAQLRIEFQTSAGALISDSIVSVSAVTSGFQFVSTNGVAPAGTAQATFTLRIQPSAVGGTSQADFDGMRASASSFPVIINATTKGSVSGTGSQTMVAMSLQNTSGATLTNVEVVVKPQAGLHVVNDQGALAGRQVRGIEGSVIYQLGSLESGFQNVFAFPVILTSAAVPGKSYQLTLQARNANGNLSPQSTVLILVEADPVFDEGTLIGKVFNDINQNFIQDSGERGVPFVRIITEEGIIVVTDENGKYHIPGLSPGRHVVKIDGHTLPEGTQFISEESRVIRTTQGIMNKVNFSVLLPPSKIPEEFKEDLEVSITQGIDFSKPKLEVSMEPDVLKTGVGVLQKDAVFRFKMNYPDFVERWYLEVRDELGREIWTGFGIGAPPPEVGWSGETEYGFLIKPGIYSYQLKVEDKKGRQDWTTLSFFQVLPSSAGEKEENKIIEIPTIGDFNIFQDGKQTVPLVAKPTISIKGKTRPGNSVTVNDYPVDVQAGTGVFQTEVYTSPGEKEIVVVATSPDGESVTYRDSVEVKDSTFFMVALGEEELGYNFGDGNLDAAHRDDQFKDGIYNDGRLSYYLRGKLKGKFLFRSHYDTSDTGSALFKNLDPEDYYPVYGDASVRDYEADGSLDRFFFVVEMDRSFVKWGSFHTEFNDTELATYNRTLNGLKVHHESLTTTPYGDPKNEVKAFWSQSEHRADHNEFAATGGTLYYLRNRQVIEGSEKLRVETRDKIQDIAIDSYDLVEGTDYEIDYDEGRIILTRPVSSYAASDSIISNDLLNGSPVYLIVDYEYFVGTSSRETANRGVRGSTHMGDHFKLGATAVEERRGDHDYDMRAVDATFKIGRNTKIIAEYAETKLQQVGQGVSYNGGLSFADVPLLHGQNTRERENAYIIKGESKPVKNAEVSGYIQGVEPGFSTDRIRSQEGYKKYGMHAKYKLHEYVHMKYRWDLTEVADQLLPLAEHGITAPFEDIQTHILQAVYDDSTWIGELEYRNQNFEISPSNTSPTLLSEAGFEHAVGAKLGYRINDKLLTYVRGQASVKGKANHQYGAGVRYEIAKELFGYVEQMFGNLGDATLFGFEKQHQGGSRSYANIRSGNLGIGQRSLTTSIGSSMPLTKKSRFFSERQYSTFQGEEGYADISGVQGQANEHVDYELRYERRHLDNSSVRLLDVAAENSLTRTNTFNTLYGAFSYTDKKRLKTRFSLEGRRDQDVPKLFQIAARHYLDYQLNPDLSFRSNVNYGVSRFLDPDDTPADFMEFNAGFAYRPVDNDKLNLLTRYTYVRDIANDLQFANILYSGVELDETSHIISLDVAYELHKYLGVVEKVAYKRSLLETNVTENSALNSFLWAHRFNFHVTRKWDLAAEYRILLQTDALKTLKHGALFEIDRILYEYVRIGVGYDFTDFSDDIRRSNGFKSHGPFVRLTGKF